MLTLDGALPLPFENKKKFVIKSSYLKEYTFLINKRCSNDIISSTNSIINFELYRKNDPILIFY